MIAYLSGQRIAFMPLRIVKPANDREPIAQAAHNQPDRFCPVSSRVVEGPVATPATGPVCDLSPFHEVPCGQ